MFRNKTGVAMRDLLESKGEDGAVEVIELALEQKKLTPEDFSLQEIWEACEPGRAVHEAMSSAAFPKITGALINSRIIAAYDGVQTIGDQLVQVVPSRLKLDTIAGFTEAETPEEVGEGQEYKSSTLTEKYVTIQNKKFGRRIDVTEEMIFFDQTGQVLNRAGRIGMKAAQYKEKLIVQGVIDKNTNVYNPSGVATAFYSTTNGNLVTSNAFNEAGLEAVELAAHILKDDSLGVTDDDYIAIDTNNLITLIPKQLDLEAWQMAHSTLVPESAENAMNKWKGKFRPLTSPYITQESSDTWFWGNFNQDFWWEEVWPLQVMTRKPGNADEFKRDIKSSTKVRFYGNVGAIDTKHSFKSTV